MSEYLVILHDAEPATDEGRSNLKRELTEKLGIAETSVERMFDSLPVILKENISQNHAEDYLRVLEALGANVEILASDGTELGLESAGDAFPNDTLSRSAASEETPQPAVTSKQQQPSPQSAAGAGAGLESGGAKPAGDEESLGSAENHSLQDLESMLDDMLGPREQGAAPSNGGASQSEESSYLDLQSSIQHARPEPAAAAEAGASGGLQTQEPAASTQPPPGLDLSFDESGVEPQPKPQENKLPEGASINDLEAMFSDALASVDSAEQTAADEKQPQTESGAGGANSLQTAGGEDSGESPEYDSSLSDLEAELNSMLHSADEEAAAAHPPQPEQAADAAPSEEESKPELSPPLGGLSLEFDEPEEPSPTRSNLDFEEALEKFGEEAAGEQPSSDLFDLTDESIQAVAETLDAQAAEQSSAFEKSKPEKKETAASPRPESKKPQESASADDEAKEKPAKPAAPLSPFGKPAKKDDAAQDKKETAAAAAAAAEAGSAEPWYKDRNLLISRGGMFVIIVLLSIIAFRPQLVFKNQEQPVVQFDPQQMHALLTGTGNGESRGGESPSAPQSTPKTWTGTTENGPVTTEVRITTTGDLVTELQYELTTEQPPELTPEELVAGVERPWLKRIKAEGVSMSEKVERIEAGASSPATILIAETPARAYVTESSGGTRLAAQLRIELKRESDSTLSGTWKLSTKNAGELGPSEAVQLERDKNEHWALKMNGPLELKELKLDLPAAADAPK